MTESLFAFKDVLDHVLYEIILEAMLINKPSLSLSLMGFVGRAWAVPSSRRARIAHARAAGAQRRI